MNHQDSLKLKFHRYAGKPEERVATAIPDFVKEAENQGEHPPFTDRTVIETLSDRNNPDEPSTVTLSAAAEETGEIVGLLIIALPESGPATAELAVRAPFRGRGVAQRLLSSMENWPLLNKFLQSPAGPLGNVRFWAHANSAGAQKLARNNGLVPLRTVRKMRLPAPKRVEPGSLQGTAIRTFHVGHDETAWLKVNSEAFATHPEQGTLSLHEFAAYEDENWFDPKGFFLAVTPDNEILGFVWTKITNNSGEIYVLGISPAAQGRGLGGFLLRYGINYLVSQGVGEIVLHVDQTNIPALRLYEQNGFSPSGSDVLYGMRNF